MNQDKYKIAEEVFTEFLKDDKDPLGTIRMFPDWIASKTKPADQLRERVMTFLEFTLSRPENDFLYTKFKEIFDDELSGDAHFKRFLDFVKLNCDKAVYHQIISLELKFHNQ